MQAYEILGVPPTATVDEIKAAYRGGRLRADARRLTTSKGQPFTVHKWSPAGKIAA